MTELLEGVIAKIKNLSSEQQEVLASLITQELEANEQ